MDRKIGVVDKLLVVGSKLDGLHIGLLRHLKRYLEHDKALLGVAFQHKRLFHAQFEVGLAFI
ncbi:hypothetical protein D3C87_2064140 [compost metagenome]